MECGMEASCKQFIASLEDLGTYRFSEVICPSKVAATVYSFFELTALQEQASGGFKFRTIFENMDEANISWKVSRQSPAHAH